LNHQITQNIISNYHLGPTHITVRKKAFEYLKSKLMKI